MKTFKGIGDAPKKTQADLIKEYVAPKVDLNGNQVMRYEWKLASLLKRNKALDINFKGLEGLKVIIGSNGSFSIAQPKDGEGLTFLGHIHSVVQTIKKDTPDEKKIMKLLLTWNNGVIDASVKPEFYELVDVNVKYEKDGVMKDAIGGFDIMKYNPTLKKLEKFGSISLPPVKEAVENTEEEPEEPVIDFDEDNIPFGED